MRTLTFFACASITLLTISAANAALSPEISYYPKSFYDNVNAGTRGDDLRAQLFDILSSGHVENKGTSDSLVKNCGAIKGCRQHFSLGYTAARKILFGKLHLQETAKGYAIQDVYCERLASEEDFKRQPPGPGQIPDSSILNAEHTWPQSHFSKKFPTDLQKSDLHILYPVLAHANSSRSNLEFSEVVTETSSPCPKARRGYTSDGGRQQFFEPPDNHKGNVARAIFYFSVRYKLKVNAAEEASLRAWNRQDPPDDFERERNNIIHEEQNDRNPFVDYPELADLIADF